MTPRTRPTRWIGAVASAARGAARAAVLLGACLAAAACTEEPPPPGTTLLYAFPILQPDPAGGPDAAKQAAETADRVARTTEEIVTKRLRAMGWAGIEVERGGSRDLRIRLPADLSADVADVRSVVERSGSLEFRLRARPSVERACAPMQPQDYPAGLRRVQWSGADTSEHPPYIVVEAPELLPPDPDHPPSDDVFVADDLATLEAVVEGGDTVLRFEMRPERKAAFTEFTKRNVERSVAILIDDMVVSAPVLMSALPGKGVIARDGAGFSMPEARTLAAILGNGRLPCRLQFITQE